MKKIDWKHVCTTPEVASAFTLEIRNRFDALSQADDNTETTYNNLITITNYVAPATLPRRKSAH